MWVGVSHVGRCVTCMGGGRVRVRVRARVRARLRLSFCAKAATVGGASFFPSSTLIVLLILLLYHFLLLIYLSVMCVEGGGGVRGRSQVIVRVRAQSMSPSYGPLAVSALCFVRV